MNGAKAYMKKRNDTIAYFTKLGYIMLEDACHMESPKGCIWHVEQLMDALEKRGIKI